MSDSPEGSSHFHGTPRLGNKKRSKPIFPATFQAKINPKENKEIKGFVLAAPAFDGVFGSVTPYAQRVGTRNLITTLET